MDTLDTHHGLPHAVRREHVFDDCIELYTKNLDYILEEFPFRIRYTKEKAIDTGGVSRDMFSACREDAYIAAFDGGNLLVPAFHPGTDMAKLPVLGAIMSHGFLACSFLPIQLAFPVIAAILLGPSVPLPDAIVMDCFVDYVSSYESEILKKDIEISRTNQPSLAQQLQGQPVDILSHLGCRELPTPQNIHHLLLGIEKHEFLMKPLGALHAIHAGVPQVHHDFWAQFSVQNLFELYMALNATPATVMCRIMEPEQLNSAQVRMLGYLSRFIGDMKQEELRRLLRFITGSSVLIDQDITVSFNRLHGFARRPISHTCSCTLELPTSYTTYLEFAHEFSQVLLSEVSWAMDSA